MADFYEGAPAVPLERCPSRDYPHDHNLCGHVLMCMATVYEGRDEPNLECTLGPYHPDQLHYDGHRDIYWKIGNAKSSDWRKV